MFACVIAFLKMRHQRLFGKHDVGFGRGATSWPGSRPSGAGTQAAEEAPQDDPHRLEEALQGLHNLRRAHAQPEPATSEDDGIEGCFLCCG